MSSSADDLRELVLNDDRELAFICAEVLAMLNVDGPGVEVLECNVVDVAVDRNEQTVTFIGVLSVNDESLSMNAENFVEVATPIAEVRTPDQLAQWRQRRQKRVWRIPLRPPNREVAASTHSGMTKRIEEPTRGRP